MQHISSLCSGLTFVAECFLGLISLGSHSVYTCWVWGLLHFLELRVGLLSFLAYSQIIVLSDQILSLPSSFTFLKVELYVYYSVDYVISFNNFPSLFLEMHVGNHFKSFSHLPFQHEH